MDAALLWVESAPLSLGLPTPAHHLLLHYMQAAFLTMATSAGVAI